MKKLIFLLLTPLLLTSCDMGTPAPPLEGRKFVAPQKIKTVTVIFKDGSYVFILLSYYNNKLEANAYGKKYKVKDGSPEYIAKQIFGDRVKSARWSDGSK